MQMFQKIMDAIKNLVVFICNVLRLLINNYKSTNTHTIFNQHYQILNDIKINQSKIFQKQKVYDFTKNLCKNFTLQFFSIQDQNRILEKKFKKNHSKNILCNSSKFIKLFIISLCIFSVANIALIHKSHIQIIQSSQNTVTALAVSQSNSLVGVKLKNGILKVFTFDQNSVDPYFSFSSSHNEGAISNTHSGLTFSKLNDNIIAQANTLLTDGHGEVRIFSTSGTSPFNFNNNNIAYTFIGINSLSDLIISGGKEPTGSTGSTIFFQKDTNGNWNQNSLYQTNYLFSTTATDGVLSFDDSILIILDSQGITILRKNTLNSHKYEISQRFFVIAQRCFISRDHMLIAIISNNEIIFYRYSLISGLYGYSSTISLELPSINDIYISPDGTRLYIANNNGYIDIYDLSGDENIQVDIGMYMLYPVNQGPIPLKLSGSNDGKYLFIAQATGYLFSYKICSTAAQQFGDSGTCTCNSATITVNSKCTCSNPLMSILTGCSSCKSGYYFDQDISDCLICGLKCGTDSCPSCNLGYFCTGSSCIQCLASNCATCIDITSSTCLNCMQGYFLDSQNYCQQCNKIIGCLICQSMQVCSACNYLAYFQLVNRNSALICECIYGYAYDDTTDQCQSVASPLSCAISQFFKPSNSACVSCDTGCLVCYGSSSYCISCKKDDNNIAYYLSADNYQCSLNCPIGQFSQEPDNILVCKLCNDGCGTCFLSASNCLSCTIFHGINYYLSTTASSCSTTCDDGQFIDSSLVNRCSVCATGCAKCSSSASTCTQCKQQDGINYYLSAIAQTCTNPCPASQYIDSNADYQCTLSCATGCLICSTTSTTCTSCTTVGVDVYYLSATASSCSKNCPDGQFKDSSLVNKCSLCATGCAKCSGTASTCTQCTTVVTPDIIPYYLSAVSSSCLTDCPVGQYINTNLANKCSLCATGCAKCSVTASSCTQCKTIGADAYYLLATALTCSTSCPAGQYIDLTQNNKCALCANGCALCSGLSTTCTQCTQYNGENYYLSVTTPTCSTSCPSGQYIDTGSSYQCASCATGCLICSTTSTTCTSCTTVGVDVYYLSATASSCSKNCPNFQFKDSSLVNKCSLCAIGCAKCSGTASTCTQCTTVVTSQTTTYYLSAVSSSCLTDCPVGQYINTNLANKCSLCATGCAKCSVTASSCTQCKTIGADAYYLLATALTCSTSCPAGQYIDLTQNNKCALCANGCALCSGLSTTCTQCTQYNGENYYLSVTTPTCSTSCPSGQYIDTGSSYQCASCATGCLICSTTSTTCTSCTTVGSAPYYLSATSLTCSTTCPDGQFIDSSLVNKCSLCTTGCAICSGSSNICTQCLTTNNNIIYYKSATANTCLLACPSGQFADSSLSNKCSLCNVGCSICKGISTSCTQCSSGYYLSVFSSNCSTSCPAGQFIDLSLTNQCSLCATGCALCSRIQSSCTQCTTVGTITYYLLATASECVTACPDGQYIDNVNNNKCALCAIGCVYCSGTATTCSQCKNVSGTIYYLLNNRCISICPQGQFVDSTGSNICTACSTGCYQCSGSASSCTQCTTVSNVAYYKSATTNVCLTVCPLGQFIDNSLVNQCSLCATGCVVCSGAASSCTQCTTVGTTAYYLSAVSSSCLTVCPTGQYINPLLLNRCAVCSTGCSVCSGSASSCTQCTTVGATSYYLLATSSICSTSCPAGQYIDLTQNNKCSPCATGCALCSGLATTCTQCTSSSGINYYLSVTTPTCSTTCPPGQYINTQFAYQCASCAIGCLLCTSTSTNCTQCTTPYYLSATSSTCSTTCPAGQFIDLTLINQCSLCATGCAICSGYSTNCTQCKNVGNTVYYLSVTNPSCLTSCPPGQFINPNLPNSCSSCNPSCVICSGNAASCTECTPVGNIPYYLSATSSICVTSCPSGQFIDSSLAYKCSSCDIGCAICSGTSSTCSQCTTVGTTVYYLSATTSYCSTTCPSGQFINLQLINQCTSCSTGCATCSGYASNCTSCTTVTSTTYYLSASSHSCLTACPSGQYINSNIPNTCQYCATSCLKCSGSASLCTQCTTVGTTTYYLSVTASSCLTSCPLGQYINSAIANQCAACSSYCLSCVNSPNNCTQCTTVSNVAYYKSATTNVCLTVCPLGQFIDNSLVNQCSLCATGCVVCSGAASSCTQCTTVGTTAYYLSAVSSSCLTVCPTGQYINPLLLNRCAVCSTGCSVCSGSASSCTQCTTVGATSYYLLATSSICSTSCPAGQYIDLTQNNKCSPCATGCALCSGLATTCTQCTSSSGINYYLSVTTPTCSTTCPPGQYINTQFAYQCASCAIGCLLCTSTSTNCTQCTTPYYLSATSSTCSTTCPAGQFIDLTLINQCSLCATGCAICSGYSTNCTQCKNVGNTVYYLSDFICSTSCPPGQYIDLTINNQCSFCSDACTLCSGLPTNCTQCAQSYFLYAQAHTCSLSCPPGSYADPTLVNICTFCNIGCLSCDSLPFNCTQCLMVAGVSYYLAANTFSCNTVCPSGQFIDSTLSNRCSYCDPSCVLCNGVSTNCTQCATAYYLKYNTYQCVATCPKGQYGTNNLCLLCNASCSTCFGSSTNCSVCTNITNTVYYLSANSYLCAPTCSAGQFININLINQCSLCNTGCKLCYGLSSNCSSCQTVSAVAYYLNVNAFICSTSCPDGQFIDITKINMCTLCNPGCALCTTTAFTCTKCLTYAGVPYYLYATASTCATSCLRGQFIDSTLPNRCSVCNVGCDTCYGIASNCSSCINSYYLNYNSSTCTTKCPAGQFIDNTLINQCSLCDTGCALCQGISSNCSQCTSVAGISYQLSYNTTLCQQNCPIGQFEGPNHPNECRLCDIGCNLCATSSSTCLQCLTVSDIAYYLNALVSQCATTCPDGQFIDSGKTNQCTLCDSGCAICLGTSSNCTRCTSAGSLNYYLNAKANQCVQSCPNGQFIDSTKSYQCSVCAIGCSMCTGLATTCSQCNNVLSISYYLDANISQCAISCRDGQFIDNDKQNACSLCATGCALCVNTSTTCTQCTTDGNGMNYYLNALISQCETSCPNGQFIDSTKTLGCSVCATGCAICFGISTSCTQCTNVSSVSYYRDAIINQCAVSCPNGQFIDNTKQNQCSQCAPGCALCSGVSTNCTQCTTVDMISYYLEYGALTCLANNCPQGQFIDSNKTLQCSLCAIGCLICSTISTSCTQCTSASSINYYKDALLSICSTSCPTGQFIDTTPYTCSLCSIGCLTCFGIASNCTQCTQSNGGIMYYLNALANQCLQNCPNGQFISNANRCSVCAVGCGICTDIPTCTQCTIVAGESYYMNALVSQCATTCPDGQFIDSGKTNQCTLCDSGCAICLGTSSNCTRCTSAGSLNYYLNAKANQCVQSCPNGQFIDSTKSYQCSVCAIGCSMCTGLATTCSQCNNVLSISYYLDANISQCAISCRDGQFIDNDKQNACSLCATGCALCVNTSTTCTQCTTDGNGMNYYLNALISQCETSCPNGQFIDSTKTLGCSVCATGCAICFGISTSCTQCTNVSSVSYYRDAIINQCAVSCPNGQFIDNTKQNQCSQCAPGCALCSGVSTNCTQCTTVDMISYYLEYGALTCLANNCPQGQFIDSNKTLQCSLCAIGCLICSTISTSCTQCTSASSINYYKDALLSICSTSCPTGQFIDTTPYTCSLCSIGCLTCFGIASNCTQCTVFSGIPYYLQYNSFICTANNCPNGQFIDVNKTYQCSLCPTGCSICSDLNTCTECAPVNNILYYLDALVPVCKLSCPNGQFIDTNKTYQCSTCAIGCVLCSVNANLCTQCTSYNGVPYYLRYDHSICLSNYCPIGQFIDNNKTYQCSLCADGCVICSGTATNCTQCTAVSNIPYYLDALILVCEQVCPNGQFIDTSKIYQCTKCAIGCVLCYGNASNCTQCTMYNQVPYYLEYNQSVCLSNNCPAGQFIDLNFQYQCSLCADGCALCNITNTTCSQCVIVNTISYYLNAKLPQCSTSCPIGQFIDNTKLLSCSICDIGCAQCFAQSSNCTKCTNSSGIVYYLQAGTFNCVPNVCPIGQFIPPTFSNLCNACNTGCLYCQSSSSNCFNCTNSNGIPYYLDVFIKSCDTTCAQGQFIDSSKINKCSVCDVGCQACSVTSSNCTSCLTINNVNYYLDALKSSCVTICVIGQFISSVPNQCSLCDSTCYTCITNANKCTSCIGNRYFYQIQSTCQLSCPSRYWSSPNPNICNSCYDGCLECTGSTNAQCQSCTENSSGVSYYKNALQNTCDTQCPISQYIASPNICQQCSVGCLTCVTSSTNCLSCSTVGTIIYYKDYSLNVCGVKCIDGQYSDDKKSPNMCLLCPTSCATCNLTNCITCKSNYYLDAFKISCVASCSNIRQYFNQTNVDCEFCSSACAACTNSTIDSCTTCQNNGTIDFFKMMSTTLCVTNCPSGQFNNLADFTCQLCNPNCSQCVSISDNCTFCSKDSNNKQYYLYKTDCLLTCPAGYWPTLGDLTLSNLCSLCFIGCSICSDPSNKSCDSCKNSSTNLYYKWIDQTICDVVCPTGQFISASIPNLCQICDKSCISCNISPTHCITCSPSYYYYSPDSTCLLNCPDSYFKKQISYIGLQCIICNAACALCINDGLQTCTKCQYNSVSRVNYYLKMNTTICTTTCAVGQYGDANTFTCQLCDVGCYNCSINSSNCFSCLTFQNTTYYKSLNSNTCVLSCPANLYRNKLNNTCEQCIFFLFNQICRNSCPQRFKGGMVKNISTCISCDGYCQRPTLKASIVLTQSNVASTEVQFSDKLQHVQTNKLKSCVQLYMQKKVSSSSGRRLLSLNTIPLNITDISISPDRYSMKILSDIDSIDFGRYEIIVDFPAGVLLTESGTPFATLSASYDLENPQFIASYYQVFLADKKYFAPGIVFFILGSLLLIGSIWFKPIYHQAMHFMTFYQLIGLLRYSSYPVEFNQYTYTSSFSYSEFNYVPNVLLNVFPSNYFEISYKIVNFVNTDHNFLRNIGSELLIFVIIQFILFIVLVRKQRQILPTIIWVEQLVITYFATKTVFSCILSFIGFANNASTIIVSNSVFIAGQALAIIVFIAYLVYYSLLLKNSRSTQLYKINVLLMVILIPFLNQSVIASLVLINVIEVTLFVIDAYKYSSTKINIVLWTLERIFALLVYDSIIIIRDETIFFTIVSTAISIVFLLKIGSLIIVYLKQKSVVHPDQKSIEAAKQNNHIEQIIFIPNTSQSNVKISDRDSSEICNETNNINQQNILGQQQSQLKDKPILSDQGHQKQYNNRNGLEYNHIILDKQQKDNRNKIINKTAIGFYYNQQATSAKHIPFSISDNQQLYIFDFESGQAEVANKRQKSKQSKERKNNNAIKGISKGLKQQSLQIKQKLGEANFIFQYDDQNI